MIMKDIMKKWIVISLVAAMAVAGFGCSSGQDGDSAADQGTVSPEEAQEILERSKQDLTFQVGYGPAEDATEGSADAEPAEGDSKSDSKTDSKADSKTDSKADSKSDSKTDSKTDAAGNDGDAAEEGTEVVIMTDEAGEPLKDDAGNVQTDVVVIKKSDSSKTDSGNDAQSADSTADAGDDNGGSSSAEQPEDGHIDIDDKGNTSGYSATYDTCKAWWLDMTRQADYFFEGEFLVLEFEVSEDAPDGNYPITIAKTDIASWEEVQYTPEIINGEVAVGVPAASQPDMSSSDFSLKVNSVAVKQGDTAKVVIDLANNPGFCGFIIDIQYDVNAMKLVDSYGGDDFNNTVSYNAD